MHGRLEVPRHLARVDVDGDQRTGEEVVTRAADAGIGGSRIAGSKYVKLCFGIVRTWYPNLTSTVARRVQVRPCFEARIAGIHRNGVKLPLQFSRFRIQRLKE